MKIKVSLGNSRMDKKWRLTEMELEEFRDRIFQTKVTAESAAEFKKTYAMTTGSYTQVTEEQAPTLMARDFKDPTAVNRGYSVRRLTPTECALLQGFPAWWCAGLETPEPTEEDIAFWAEVWETHRKITGTSTKPKSRNQLVKWLKSPHSDAAEYRLWGNGVALPCVFFVLAGIVMSTQLNGG